ncbi:MAG: Crp/Fnr family transcriptional regulator [Chitinophagaceae bacterium]|nr:Crp/Fnr family transcriptional regulator [Chitinophagaceae bacterium]
MSQQNNFKKAFFDSFKALCPEINKNEINFLNQNSRIVELKKGAVYLDNSKVQKSLGFVVKGLMRGYYLDDKGSDITISFIKENEYVTDYISFLKQSASRYYFICLEDCILIELSYDNIQQGYRNSKTFEKYGRLIAEKVLEERINRVEKLQFLNAKERYNEFLNNNFELLTRIKLSHLCTYLGIERQSLTRIRKEIHNNGTNVST